MKNIIAEATPVWDITVENSEDIESIKKICTLLFPSWNTNELRIKVFEGGLSSTVILVENGAERSFDDSNDIINENEHSKVVANQHFLIRIYGLMSKILLDNWTEIQYMYILSKLGSKQSLLGIFSNGLVCSFVSGLHIACEEFSHPSIKPMIINEMARLHSLPIKPLIKQMFFKHTSSTVQDYNDWMAKHAKLTVFDQIRQWISQIPIAFELSKQTEKLIKEYPSQSDLFKEVSHVQSLLSNPLSSIVLCHNDLLAENIIQSFDKTSVYFIDLEYTSFNHAAFDVANHFCEYAGIKTVDFGNYPNLDYQRGWIKHYLEACKFYSEKFDSLLKTGNDIDLFDYYSIQYDLASDSDRKPIDSLLIEEWIIEVNNSALASHLFWSVWAVLRSSNSEKRFDYFDYGKTRMNQYYEMKSKMAQTCWLRNGQH